MNNSCPKFYITEIFLFTFISIGIFIILQDCYYLHDAIQIVNIKEKIALSPEALLRLLLLLAFVVFVCYRCSIALNVLWAHKCPKSNRLSCQKNHIVVSLIILLIPLSILSIHSLLSNKNLYIPTLFELNKRFPDKETKFKLISVRTSNQFTTFWRIKTPNSIKQILIDTSRNGEVRLTDFN